MIRTAIYMRVSSDKQAQEGDSIPAQRAALQKYIADRPDMILAGEYLDDGVSGTKEDRDELQRMLSDVKDGRIDRILVTKLDRLFRSIKYYLNLQDTLDKCGVGWTAIWEPIYDTTTPQGRLIINQMMSIAQFEAENTGQRIRQVQAYKVQQGEVISGAHPPGFKIEGKHLVPDENAGVVREAFEYYARTGNLTQTIRRFDHYAFLPNSKGAWKAILRNTRYIGEAHGNRDFCEPIVDRDLFYDVQRKLGINVKVSQKRTYIFSGLLRCAECGSNLGGQFQRIRRGKEVNLKYYRCPRYYNRGSHQCTNPKGLAEHILERYLLENVREQLQGIVLKASAEAAPVHDNSARIAALEKRLGKLKELYVNDLLTIGEYKEERETILSEISDLSSQEPQKGVDVDAINRILAEPFEVLYDTFSEDQKRFFWRSILKEIRFGKDRSIEFYFLPGDRY